MVSEWKSEVEGGRRIAQRAFEDYGKEIDELETKIHAVEHPWYVDAIRMGFDSMQAAR